MSDSSAPLLLPLPDAQRMLGISRASIYRMLGRGEISARKIGDRILIDAASIRAYVDRLPAAVIRTGRRQPARTTPPAP